MVLLSDFDFDRICHGDYQVMFIITNVSIKRELERERLASHFQEIMYASISHELRTPCNAINNSLMCMQPHVGVQGKPWFDIARSSTAFLLSLVNDTLDMAQLKSGKFHLNFSTVTVKDMVTEIYDLIRVQLIYKEEVEFRVKYGSDVPATIDSDQ